MEEQKPLQVLQDWLDSYLNFERTPKKNIFWLDTMEFLCRKFHSPQTAVKSIHVAGSKGKGSVSVMIASVMEAAGKHCGLYTSPHILDFSERIGTAAGPLTDDVYESSARELMDSVRDILPEQLPGERPVTWFELVTLFAFLCFRNAGFEWAVYETGLGGRLDSTNVLQPEISVITPVELEHCEFLGNTIGQIAFEKAGIIKTQTPVCLAGQQPAALQVFKKVAAEKKAPMLYVPETVHSRILGYTGYKMNIELTSDLFSRPVQTSLSLPGTFQAQNAATAAATIKSILPEITEEQLETGLSRAFLPGRFEITGTESHPVILDGAHTVNSIRYTLETLKVFTGSMDKKPYLLFACASDKHVEEIAPLFAGFDSIILTIPGEQKTSDPERLRHAFSSAGLDFTFMEDYRNAIHHALRTAGQNESPLLITGSFYLVAEVKKLYPQLQRIQSEPVC